MLCCDDRNWSREPIADERKFYYYFFNEFAVKADTLSDMIDYMTSRVGLVHQMPFTCDREGFPATFEKVNDPLLFINITIFDTFFFRSICRYSLAQCSREFTYVPIYSASIVTPVCRV